MWGSPLGWLLRELLSRVWLRPSALKALNPMETGGSDSSMVVLVSGILLLGGIALFIGWGLSHAYPSA